VSDKLKSRVILECYRRAAQARRMAEATTNLSEKMDFFEIEKTRLSLSRSPELWARQTPE
jgi:hypothetical protein